MFLRFPPCGTEQDSGWAGGSRHRCTHKLISSGKCSRRDLLLDEKEQGLEFSLLMGTRLLEGYSSGGRAKVDIVVFEAQKGGGKAVLLGEVLRRNGGGLILHLPAPVYSQRPLHGLCSWDRQHPGKLNTAPGKEPLQLPPHQTPSLPFQISHGLLLTFTKRWDDQLHLREGL